MKHRLLSGLAALAVIGSGIAGHAVAQTGPALLESLFAGLEDSLRNAGQNVERVADFSSYTNNGATREHLVQLQAGATYSVVAFCDEDCSDLDLEVRTSGGQVVGSDFRDDDNPVVNVTNAAGGAYVIRNIMADCAAEPCLTGVRIYRWN